ncbi:hypothetical protein VB735_10535 [Halotia wernerae UHCC 0503]|nr:hypothetical protein [Halotia wernerae UHCC 0503]
MSSEMMFTDTASDLVIIQPETQALNNQNLNELAQALVEFKLSANTAEEENQQQLRRLRRQVMVLKGSLAIILILLGSLGVWLMLSLRDVQIQLGMRSQQRQTENTSERLLKLENQFNSLNSRAAESQQGITEIRARLDTIQADLNQRQRAIAVLAKSLQELVEETPTSAASPAPLPSSGRGN